MQVSIVPPFMPTRTPPVPLSPPGPLEKELLALTTTLDGISRDLHTQSLKLHGRDVHTKKIRATYDTWKKTIATTSTQLGIHEMRLTQLAEAHLDIGDKFVDTLKTLRKLVADVFLLQEECEQLKLLVNAPLHQAAFVVCRKAIREANAIRQKKKITAADEAELRRIQSNLDIEIKKQTAQMGSLNPYLKRCITVLHEDADGFLTYAVGETSIDEVADQLKGLNLNGPQAPSAPARQRAKNVEEVTLPAELEFKPRGVLFPSVFPSWRFGSIYSNIDEMRHTTSGIADLHRTLKTNIIEFCQGCNTDAATIVQEAARYAQTSDALQTDLKGSKEKLYKGEFAKHLDKSLEYAAEIMAYSEKIGHLSRIFQRLVVDPGSLKLAKAVLDLRTVFKFPDPTSYLFTFVQEIQMIDPIQSQDPFVVKVAATARSAVKRSLEQRGELLLTTPNAEELELDILQKKPVADIESRSSPGSFVRPFSSLGTLPKVIEALVKNECLKYPLFSEKRGDIFFSCILHILETEYAAAFQRSVALTPTFKDIVSFYKQFNPYSQFGRYFTQFATIFAHIRELNAHAEPLYLSQVRYLLSVKLELPDELQELYDKAERMLEEHSGVYEFDLDESQQALYQKLMKAVWGKDIAAKAEVERIRGDDTLLHPNPLIQTLLDELLLHKVKNQEALSSADQTRLSLLLCRYLGDGELQQALGNRHNFYFMEMCISKAILASNEAVHLKFVECRDLTYQVNWDDALEQYRKWKHPQGGEDSLQARTFLYSIVKEKKKGYELFFNWILKQLEASPPQADIQQ